MDATCDLCPERANSFGVGYKLCRPHFDELWEWKGALEKEATTEAGGPWPQTCPRRYEMFQRGGEEGQDEWQIRANYRGTMHRSCSYCGSLHPDDFMERVHAGDEVGATDKNYKAYLGPGHDKFYFQHLSDDQKREFVDLYNQRRIRFSGGQGFYRFPFFMAPVE